MLSRPHASPCDLKPFRACGSFIAAALLAAAVAVQAAPPAAVPATELQIITDPADAVVFIDREERGSTPLTVTGLAAGEHLVLLSKRGFRDHYVTVLIGANTRRTLDVALEPLATLLLAHSVPAGATVSAGGVDLGVTPLLLTSLAPGTHRLRFALPGFQATEREVSLEGRTPLKVAVELVSDSGTLAITTEPPGAAVTVNGIPRGASPCTVERIPEGEAVIDIRAEGFLDVSQRVKLAAGEIQNLNLALRPKPARLLVTSLPPGARVYVNNERRGETPLTLAELEPGAYRLRVEQEGFDPLARDVQLGRGAEAAEEFRLTANTGALQLTTTPADVEVFIAGKPVGKTLTGKDETTNLSNPLRIDGLRVGAHALKLVRKGWAEKTLDITVERGQTLTQHVALDRLFIPDYEVITAAGTVYRGVFDAVTDLGVRMETAPGVMTVIPLKDIRKRGSLRDDAADRE